MRRTLLLALLALNIHQIAWAQSSPWGTGSISGRSLDALSGKSVYTSHTSDVINATFNLNNYLSNYTYDLYIPPGYDGSKPYGLITYINYASSGQIPEEWLPVLNEKNIIMIAGNNIENGEPLISRMGVALAGAKKIQEILNIDESRVYTSGKSGGARASVNLLFFFPEEFQGTVPNCGASYLRKVDQDYETRDPDSHYEYTQPYTSEHLAYVKSFDRKYAIMTQFNDFREGDIMNIYHNGMEPDGFKSKFLEKSGGHCDTNAEQFRDAINFVEHPHIKIVQDQFNGNPAAGEGFKTENASVEGQQLVLNPNASGVARAYSNDPFLWNDPKGAILRTSVELDAEAFDQNTYFNIGLLDYSDPAVYNQAVGDKLYEGKPHLLVSISFDDTQPTVQVLAENPSGSASGDVLFRGKMTDWPVGEPLDIKYHLWNQEVRIEFGAHFQADAQTGSMTKLLDDNRSIRIRTNGNYWDSSDFAEGTLLTLVAGKLNNASTGSKVKVDFVEVIAANTLDAEIPKPEEPSKPEGAIMVPAVSPAPVIDGTAETLWQALSSYSPEKLIRGSRSAQTDLAASFRTAWDAEYLYLLVEVTDEQLVNDSDQPWEDDGVEVYIDIDNNKTTSYGANDYQLIFGYGEADVRVLPTGRSLSGVEWAESTTEQGYLMEIALPWEALGQEAPSPDVALGIDLHVNDDDDGGQRDAKLAWAAEQDNAYQNPSVFGTAVLGTEAATSTEIIVYAAGRTNTEKMELRLDGQAVTDWPEVGGNAQNRDFVAYRYQAPGTITASQVAVAFVNDDGANRDLRVDRIVVGGTTYQSEASDTYSTGTWRSSDGCQGGYKQSEWLHCNGFLAYAQSNARTGQPGKQATVADADGQAVGLFPNPGREVVHLRLAGQGEAVITLVDSQGREWLHHRQASGGSVDLVVDQLPAGVYSVRVQQDGQATTHKLILK